MSVGRIFLWTMLLVISHRSQCFVMSIYFIERVIVVYAYCCTSIHLRFKHNVLGIPKLIHSFYELSV